MIWRLSFFQRLKKITGEQNMSKSQDAKKETKKKPALTMKEKKLAKLEKKKLR
jgi:hypothetical protein